MSTSPDAPPPPRRSFDFNAWLPSRRSLLWVLGAFALGLLLFLLVGRNDSRNGFYRAGADEPTTARPSYTPLPVPVSGNDDEVSGLAAPATDPTASGERPHLVETAPPPPPAAIPASVPPAAPVAASQPQPISTPAPKYPARALRRGERGTVTVSVQVGPNGIPARVEVATTSGSRLLDRAAVDAVRRWRFRPALAEGQPVAGEVRVPITFDD